MIRTWSAASRRSAAGVSGAIGAGVACSSSARIRGANEIAVQPTVQTVDCTSTAAIVLPARIACSAWIERPSWLSRPITVFAFSSTSIRATPASSSTSRTHSANTWTYGRPSASVSTSAVTTASPSPIVPRQAWPAGSRLVNERVSARRTAAWLTSICRSSTIAGGV